MAVFRAEMLTTVDGHIGDCLISVNGQALSLLHPSEHSVIGRWQYGGIRRFRADVSTFVFESGRKGPFGAGEYRFEMSPPELQQLQSTITLFTGATFLTKVPPPPAAASQGDMVESNAVEPTTPAEEVVRKESVSSEAYSPASVEALLEVVRELALTGEGENASEEEGPRGKGRVYSELVDTEHAYVADLKTVIDAYYDAMDPDSVSIPLRLRGKRHIVFGNLQDIYSFHDKVFSQALEFFAKCPERVGLCFTHFASEFELYSSYCKNRSRSDVLVNEGTESQAFFKGIQRNLGHQFDLSSYLHKPVQRITKYQLLLKDLLKHAVSQGQDKAQSVTSGLDEAYKQMCKILQDLNDSLHTAGLKGLPDDLPEPGKLLAHDRFLVSVLEPGPLTFSRSREKHVFLFEKLIVLSKKVESTEGGTKKARKSEVYLYKEHLDLTVVTLRESVDINPLVFSLALHKQQREFKFEAHSHEVQEMWANEIRRLLQLQFTRLKMQHEKISDASSHHTPQLAKKVIDTTIRTSSSCECLARTSPDMPTLVRSSVLTEKPQKKGVRTTLSNPSAPPPNESAPMTPPPVVHERNGHSSPPLSSNGPSSHSQIDRKRHRKTQDQEKQQQIKTTPSRVAVSEHRSKSLTNITAEPSPKSSTNVTTYQRNSKNLTNGKTRVSVVPATTTTTTPRKGGLTVDDSVSEAIEIVRSGDKEITWCVCSFRDNNHKEPLTVCGEGDGSLDSLRDHLQDDNIVFGLLKVVEKLDGMARGRLVYIQWMGERSRPMTKAKITTHRSQIEELFQPYHLALFASSRTDLTQRVVMDKLASISGTKNYVL